MGGVGGLVAVEQAAAAAVGGGLAIEYRNRDRGVNLADRDIRNLREKIESVTQTIRPLDEQVTAAQAATAKVRWQADEAVATKSEVSGRWMVWLESQQHPADGAAAAAKPAAGSSWRIMCGHCYM